MTDNKQEENKAVNIPSEAAKPSEQPSDSVKTSTKEELLPPKKTAVSMLSIFSLGLSAAALATSGWIYFQNTQSTIGHDIEQLKAQQTNLQSTLDSNTVNLSQLNHLAEQVKKTQQATQAQNDLFDTFQTQASQKIQSLEAKLNRLNNTTKEDWKLAEAEYLIRLANQRLLLESDKNSAVALLINADDILKALADPVVFDTRKALAKDIQALKSISTLDLEGAYLQLNALYNGVTTLPQREPSKAWQDSNADNTQDSQNTTKNKIVSVLDSFWQSLRSLIVINYQHKPIKALLPPEEYQELVTSLQLQLDIAQVALIKGEPTIYQQALSRVANAVTEHFDTSSNLVTTFLASLTTLQQINPTPKLPLPRESLITMKALVQTWNNRNTEQPTTSETTHSATATGDKE